MKKLIFLISLLFISCSEYDAYENGVAYEHAFKEYIGGNIHPLLNWGFTAQTTRAVNPNSNEWTNIPKLITQSEIDKVVNEFSKPSTDTEKSLVNWTDFYVQHVYGAHSNMDWLCSYANKELKVISWWPYESELVNVEGHDDHIYNFNATKGSILLMQNSTTERFGFFNSLDSKMHYNYCMKCIDGQYYIGFDFEATGLNLLELRDYIFNDWIIKICPAVETKRIIVEDLVANLEHLKESDWDYNDAVFDISFNNGVATITLLAAGGTLPLYIGGHEVHAEFGEGLHPINVYGTITHNPVTFQIRNISDDIPVTVTNNGRTYELKANVGQAPAKICVGTDYLWCTEWQHIKSKYPRFVDYCKYRIENWY